MDYLGYEFLLFDRPDDGILRITLNRPESLNAMNAQMQGEVGRVWKDVDLDTDARVVILTGAGRAFCAGGDFSLVSDVIGSFAGAARDMEAARAMVYNMMNCDTPIISAVNGDAVGGGLCIALMADISVVADDARLRDGHLDIGIVPGDHAAMIWPLLCGLAKAKYYLFTRESLSGLEAERIGLVSRAVPRSDVVDQAMTIAQRIAVGPRTAQMWTKRALNHWLRAAVPIFEVSLAQELLGFFDADISEGVKAIQEKRTPRFPSAE